MTHWRATLAQLLRRPAFPITASVLLALGIGINTTVFAVVETVLLKPLPYLAADQLAAVLEANPAKHELASLIAPARLEDWNRLNQAFMAISGSYSDNVTDTSASAPERLSALRVSPRYFEVFEKKPVAGRTFTKQEETFGGPGAAIISAGLWKRRFNNESKAVGSRLLLAGQGYTVVGVMPNTFVSPAIDVWLPAPMNPYLAKARDARFLVGIGRMKQSKKEQVVGDRGRAIWMALAGTSMLLILSCINIASLLIGRLYQREREFAVRASLGATRLQVAAVILRELSVIAVLGCALGVYLSYSSIDFISKAFANLPRMAELEFNGRTILFALGLGLVFLLFVGLLPLLRNAPSSRLSEVLAQSGRSQASARHPFQRYLLIGQFALTVILLCTAGLLLRSYYRLSTVDTGFDSQNVLTFHVGAEWSEDRKAVARLQQQILADLRRLPNVEAVGVTNFLPTDGATLRYQYELKDLGNTLETHISTAGSRTVSPGYLAALRIPLLQGKSCPELAEDNGPAKALVNRAFVDQFAPGVNLLGKHASMLGLDNRYTPELLGVIANVREDSANVPAAPYLYLCATAGGWPDPEYVVRIHGDARVLFGTVQKIVHQVAPTRAVFGLQTMQDHVATALGQPLLTARMLSAFAIAALALAAFGLYSLTTLTVTSQTREIGTRMALGAYTGQIMTEVFVSAAKLMIAGLAIGIIGTMAAAHVLRSFLFGVTAEDPLTYFTVCPVLTTICFVATLVPALRAASIDPLQALRTE